MTQRPTINGSTFTTPEAGVMASLLGASCFGPVAITGDEFRAIKKLYGFVPEGPNEKPAPPEPPKREAFGYDWEFERALKDHERALAQHARWEDPKDLLQAGADRNAMRYAEADGLRLLAWIAKFVPAGEDPLKHLIGLVAEAGLDVSPADLEWANDEA